MKAKYRLLGLVIGLGIFGSIILPPKARTEGAHFLQVKQVNKARAVPSETKRDRALERAIVRQYGSVSGTNNFYHYNRVDLNGDKKPEVLVHLIGPAFCGTGGCTTLVFKSAGNNYQIVSATTVSSTPIIVTETKTNGWNDLMMGAFGGGRGEGSGYYLCKFNGKKYPNIPENGTKIAVKAVMSGKAYFDDSNKGIELRP